MLSYTKPKFLVWYTQIALYTRMHLNCLPNAPSKKFTL